MKKPRRESKNIKKLRRVLYLVSWFRPYIPNLSEYCAIFNDCFKRKPFTWNEELQAAWLEFLKTIQQTVTLNQPDFNLSFSFFTDASAKGISGILVQNNKLIRVYSSKLSEIESIYTRVERELLAIIKAMFHFRLFLPNTKVYIHTDNKNITYIKTCGNKRSQR